MKQLDFRSLLELAKSAALCAGADILQVYHEADLGIEIKDDKSPLTKADKKAHIRIIEGLKGTGIPVLSEEGRSIPFEERKNWDLFWMIDPLDGTKEFIKKNGEFTVNIALIEEGNPVLGVVYAPVLDTLYYGGTSVGFSKMKADNLEVDLPKRTIESIEELKLKNVRIVASRSHQNQATEEYINSYASHELVRMGSSLKFMVLAEGNADVYPRFAPTMEWDTAAADAVLRGLGYSIFKVSEKYENLLSSIDYNKESLLNPYFICF
jgi:3'(2'), 5'-bisphosphate nucleotidase